MLAMVAGGGVGRGVGAGVAAHREISAKVCYTKLGTWRCAGGSARIHRAHYSPTRGWLAV